MKLLKLFGILVALAGAAVLAATFVPSVYGQSPDRVVRDFMILEGRGSGIGVRVRDVTDGGVTVEEVQPGSPAEKAGVKAGDRFVEFDGERVRSGRQFARLVQETPPGRKVKAIVMRDGQQKDLEITPDLERGRSGVMIDGGRLRGRLGDLRDSLPPFDLNFDFEMPGIMSSGRLGVSVQDMTEQLAKYFGAQDGALVTAVTDGSAAQRAGLRAGDVITAVNGRRVRSREDLLRELRDVRQAEAPAGNRDTIEVTIGIVRDRKESTVTAKIEPPRRFLRGARPV
jgi:serine protease Do